jgi:hypothetical protein
MRLIWNQNLKKYLKMTNQEKAIAYDNYIRESDYLQRENSNLKSTHTGNIPPNIMEKIKANERKISIIVGKVEELFRM